MSAGPGGGGRLRDVAWLFLSVAARLATMALCAAAITVAVHEGLDAALSSARSLGAAFDRLSTAMAIGCVAGAALGGVLTHRVGRGTYGPEVRTGLSIVAAVPFLILAALLVLDR